MFCVASYMKKAKEKLKKKAKVPIYWQSERRGLIAQYILKEA
jgi:hypothetical protein